MTLLKRFTVWAIASNKIPSKSFKSLWVILLLAYVTATAIIFGISATAIYVFFRGSLEQQLNESLLTLSQAAVPGLDLFQTKSKQNLERELPWPNLFFKGEQSLEWFDTQGKLIAQKGRLLVPFSLNKKISPLQINEGSAIFEQQGQIRSVTISVYARDINEKTLRLKGYIRAGQSTRQLAKSLNRLRLGLELGGVCALLLTSVGGIYLTRQALKPTVESYQQLSQFTADAAHELRSPLTTISVATEMVLNNSEKLEPSDAKKLAIIAKAVAQMKYLVEDLVFLAQTDAVPLTLSAEQLKVSLDELLLSSIERFEPIAETKNITIQSKVLTGLSVQGNAAQLSRLFSNLLENAIKYTNPGGKVSISASKKRKNVVIYVKDTGVGIPAEHLPYVFHRFWRAEQVKSQEGFGLGLAIASAIAQKHGGEIAVTSELGVGSCFQVRLPLI